MKTKGRWLGLILIVAFTSTIHAEDPTWNHVQIKDPLTSKVVDRFSLEGVYLAPPYGTSARDQGTPKLILMCSNGRLVRQIGITQGFLQPTVNSSSMGAKIDAVIDDGRKKTVSTDVDSTQDRLLTDDNSQRQYRIFELGNILTDLLHGKSITMVVREDRGGSTVVSSSVPHQVLMEFHVPSLAPVLSVCGTDRAFRGIAP